MANKINGEMDIDLNLKVDPKKVSQAADLTLQMEELENYLSEIGEKDPLGNWSSKFKQNQELIDAAVDSLREMKKQFDAIKLNVKELETLQSSINTRRTSKIALQSTDSRDFQEQAKIEREKSIQRSSQYLKGTITREDVKDLEAYTKAMNALQSKAKSLRDFQEVQKKALNSEEEKARKQTEDAIRNGTNRGIEYTRQEIQQMFEAFSLNDYIEKVGKTLKRGVGVDDRLEFLTRSTYPSFIGDNGKIIPSFYKTEEGTIIPKTSMRPAGDRLKYSPYPEFNDLGEKSLGYIAEYYNKLIEDGSENALKYAKNISDAIIEAYQNSASPSVKKDFENRLSQLIPDTDDFLHDTPFWREMRTRTGIGVQMDDVSWLDNVPTSKTQGEKQADRENEDNKTRVKVQKAQIITNRQIDSIIKYVGSQEFRNLMLTILSGGIVTNENGKTVDYSQFTPNQLRDVVSTILNQSYVQAKNDDEVDYRKVGSLDVSGDTTRYDEEVVARGKEAALRAEQASDSYKAILTALWDTFNDMYQTATAEGQARLEPTMRMLDTRVNGPTSDAKQLVNALSNYTAYGGVIQDSWLRFSKETGMESSIGDTLGWLDDSVKTKVADSIKVNNQIGEILNTALADLQANINNTNLTKSKNKEIADLAKDILGWNVDDLFDNFSRIETFQANFAEDAKTGSLGKFHKSRTELNNIFSQLDTQLFSGFTGLQNEDRDFNNIIDGIKQFKDDYESFHLFLRQFYSETYGIGASSINFNEEEAEKNRRGIQRPEYGKGVAWNERSPKQRFIGSTQFMDVLGLYGAKDVDTGIEITGRRLAEYEQKLSEENEDRKYASEIIAKIDSEIADYQKTINDIANKYPGKTSKSEVGGWKVDWDMAKDPALGGGIELSEVNKDKRAFEKAQENILRLRDSKDYTEALEEVRKIDSGESSNALKRAIEIIKEDIEYLKKAKAYINESLNDTRFGSQLALPVQGSVTIEDQKWQENLRTMTTPRVNIPSGDIIELGEVTKDTVVALQEEEYQIEDLNKDLDIHEQSTQDAAQAEKAKMAVSEDLVKQLLQEAQAYNKVIEATKEEVKEADKVQSELEEIAKTGKSGDVSIEGFIPNFNEKKHQYSNPETGEKFFSITQLRDALISGQNPTFGIDIDRIKKKAQTNAEKGLGAISIDDFEGMKPEDYKLMVEGVIGQGLRGDIFHSLIDKMVKSSSTTMDELEKNDNEAFKKWQDEYKDTVNELAKYGIGEEFLGISERLESYMDAVKKSGLSATEFSEQRLAFKIKGDRGTYSVGVTPDQFYSMNGIGAFMDNKTGAVHGQEAFQLTAQMFATLANLDNEVSAWVENKETGLRELKKVKVKDLIGDIDLTAPIKGYIADIGDGITELKEYALMNLKEFYDLVVDAVEIKEGKRGPLPKEERNRRMNRQLKTGTFIGMSDAYEETIGQEIYSFSGPGETKRINEYLRYQKQIANLTREINELEKQREITSEDELDNLDNRIDKLKQERTLLNKNIPQLMVSNSGTFLDNGRDGKTLLSDAGTAYLMQRMDEINANMSSRAAKAEQSTQKKINTTNAKEQNSYLKSYLNSYEELLDLERQEIKLQNNIEVARARGFNDETISGYEAELEDVRKQAKALRDELEDWNIDRDNSIVSVGNTEFKMLESQARAFYDNIKALDDTNKSELLSNERAFAEKKQSLQNQLQKQYEALVKKQYQAEEKLAQTRKDAEGMEENDPRVKAIKNMEVALEEANAELKAFDDRLANSKLGININKNSGAINTLTGEHTIKIADIASREGGMSAENKAVTQYLNNLKKIYKVQEDLLRLENKMQDQSGEQLNNSKIYQTSLKNQEEALKKQQKYFDASTGKLGEMQLHQQNVAKIQREINNLSQQHESNLAKINAQQRNQRNILQEIAGGFKDAFRNMTDASVAYEIIGWIRQGIYNVINATQDMDAALVDLQIASGGTREEMHDLMIEYNQLAKQMGKSTTEVAQAANDWLRAGYEGAEATELTEASTRLATLGMTSTADATSYLISVLKGWKLEASEVSGVVDKLVSVDMAAALNY